MTKKRIFFTGGSGKAGKHVIPYLLDQGHRVMNVDLVPLDYPGVDNLIPSNVFSAGTLRCYIINAAIRY